MLGRQHQFIGDHSILSYYENIWNRTTGNSFDKSLALLCDYCGYDSWAIRIGRTYKNEIKEIIVSLKRNYQSDLNHNAFFILLHINQKIQLININFEGDLAAVIQVIHDKTGINAFSFDSDSANDMLCHYNNPQSIKSILHNTKKLQSFIRGAHIRDKYQVNQLAKLEDYQTLVIGNDPLMPIELDHYAEPIEKIAFVATSGMRVLPLACNLGNEEQLPKIFLVDNSEQVTTFWSKIKDFTGDDAKASTENLFLRHLPDFLCKHKELYRDINVNDYKEYCNDNDKVKYLSQDINLFFQSLFMKYRFDYVRNIILHTSVIKQSWGDMDTFRKIKNITAYLGINKIYMYPSNIVSYISGNAMRNQVLANIASMSPVLSIHTDICSKHQMPENVFLFTNQNPSEMKSAIFQSKCLNPPRKIDERNMLNMNEVISILSNAQNLNNNKVNNNTRNLY